jgi:hypothetical protein
MNSKVETKLAQLQKEIAAAKERLRPLGDRLPESEAEAMEQFMLHDRLVYMAGYEEALKWCLSLDHASS